MNKNLVNIKFKNGNVWNNVVILDANAKEVREKECIAEILDGKCLNYSELIECINENVRGALFRNQIESYFFAEDIR